MSQSEWLLLRAKDGNSFDCDFLYLARLDFFYLSMCGSPSVHMVIYFDLQMYYLNLNAYGLI